MININIADAMGASADSGGRSTVQRIYDDLRSKIISFDLPPDTTLSREELTGQYSVSLTPIREALQRLEQDGLIKIHPQSKTVVTRIDIQQMFEAFFLRMAVETDVVRGLAKECDPSIYSRARSIVRMQQAIVDDADQIDMFYELDEAFHQTLFIGIGQLNLYKLLKSRSGHLGRLRRLGPPLKGKFPLIIEGHTDILKGIETQDDAMAMTAMRDHLSQTVSISRVKDLQSKFPQYFKSA